MIKQLRGVLLFFLFFMALSVQAQQKIYNTLGTMFKGLRKDQITIYGGYAPRVSFTYDAKKYRVYFTVDTLLNEISEVIKNELFPDTLRSDLNCFYQKYTLVEWGYKIHYYPYYNNKSPEKNLVVIISTSATDIVDMLEYWNGERPKMTDPLQKQGEDYMYMDGMMDVSGANGHQWYGGSGEAFADSLEKQFQQVDKGCLKQFNNENYQAIVKVNEDGSIIFSGIAELAPYQLNEILRTYCKTIKFPSQDLKNVSRNRYCTYKLKIIISAEKGVFVEP